MAPPSASPQPFDERTLGGAVHDVWQTASTLAQQHAALASSELTERTKGVGTDAVLLVSGAVVLHAATLAFLCSAALGLYAAGVSPWQAGFAVAVLTAVVGVVLVALARARLRRRSSGPSDTLLAFKETGQWLTTLTRTRR